MAEERDVSRGTVLRAVDYLQQRGLLRGEVGRGVFVVDAIPDAAGEPTIGERVAELERWRAEHEQDHEHRGWP